MPSIRTLSSIAAALAGALTMAPVAFAQDATTPTTPTTSPGARLPSSPAVRSDAWR